MPKILVTGGAGYIGSHTIIELLNSGYDILSVDNYSNSSESTYNRIKDITRTEILFEQLDLSNQLDTDVFFEKHTDIDGIIHFAALKSVPDSVERPIEYYRNNNDSLLNVLEQVQKHSIKATIFSSSCSVYGNLRSDQLPVVETTSWNEAECPYANTKQMGEDFIRNFSKICKQNFIALRYFNPVGAHISGLNGEMPSKVVNNLAPIITQAAAGLRDQLTVFGDDYNTRDGSCIRDYIHVSDIAKAHVKAIDLALSNRMENNFDVINLGSGNGITVFEAIQAFENTTGIKVPYQIGSRRPGDVEAIFSDCTKAESTLNWKCQYDINDMMKSAWKWQQYLIQQNLIA
ncbi:UDP-glucose 4-epimerase GalE [bacterium SCSIO 12643]|nr:UDP-glucose 4-epimerase GalE [bacterium SCSIO 12643]